MHIGWRAFCAAPIECVPHPRIARTPITWPPRWLWQWPSGSRYAPPRASVDVAEPFQPAHDLFIRLRVIEFRYLSLEHVLDEFLGRAIPSRRGYLLYLRPQVFL